MTSLFLDIESYSEVPIKNGVYAYAEGAETMLMAYVVGEGPVAVWDLTETVLMPADLKAALADDTVEIVLHNSNFDRMVLRYSPCITLPVRRIHDTMVRALSHSLPGGLGRLCEVLGVPIDKAKDKRGHDLIQLFCKPRGKTSKIHRATRETHPVQWKEFVEYARLDVEAMREVYKRLPNWNYKGFEYELWVIDQTIADRGIAIDTVFVQAAIGTVLAEQDKLSRQTLEATDGAVSRTTQRDRLLGYIKETYGIVYENLTSSLVERAIADENTPEDLRQLLMLRAQASTSSTAKYRKFQGAVSSDGRLRGMLQFNGAARTGRDAGRIVQLQNLPRQTMKPEDIETGIRAIKKGAAQLLFDDVMELSSNAIRGCLVADPGKKLVIADLSNIEGRITAWYGGEVWKLKAFEKYDFGVGPDLYELTYANSTGTELEDVDKYKRQIGKTMELFLGFQGGVGAFSTGARALGIDLNDLAEKAERTIPADIMREARHGWEWARKEKRTHDLSQKVFTVCDALKRLWRRTHPGIVSLWKNVDGAFNSAMDHPGRDFRVGRLGFRRDGSWMRVVLPSGRCLCYPSPRKDEKGLSYLGINPYTKQWGRVRTYAGKLVENCVQSTARDILWHGVKQAEKNDYPVVLRVHDELITEVFDTEDFTVDELCKLMTTNIAWAGGLPLAAAGFESYRYHK